MADGGDRQGDPGRRGTLPGTDAEERVVVHVDVDCFYAAAERLREPELRGEPVVVGMGFEPGERHGAVATASYEARAHGVESAMGIGTALDRLPRVEEADGEPAGHYRPVDMEFYEGVAADVRTVLDDLADTVRAVSIDEAYLDVTGRTDWSVAAGFARHVKQRIDRAAGVTASVGVAPTMSAAKVASDHDKPDGLVVVPPGEVRAFLAPLDVEEIHGVGPVTAGDLRDMGVRTAGDLAAADPARLVERFGENGRELWRRARGVDPRPVEPTGRPKSLSRESAFAEPVADHDRVRERATGLAADVARRAREHDARYRTIGVKVVTPPYDVRTRAHSLPGPVEDPDLLEEVTLDLLAEFADETVRKLGVRVANLEFGGGQQARLDGWEDRGSAMSPEADTGASTAEESPPSAGWVQTTLAQF
jgi:DNA polymerase IV (DinB-like DNA polymerase)